MAAEVQISYVTGRTLYYLIRNTTGSIWQTTTDTFVAYVSANYANYTVALTEQGAASAYYTGNFPTQIGAGTYSIVAKSQVGGSAAESDPTVGTGQLEWNGVAISQLSDTSTSGQIASFAPLRLARGIAISNFEFCLMSSSDHITSFTSGICSGQISRDGGGFVALQSGSFSEIGLGFYSVNLTSGDLNASTIGIIFSANGISGGSSDLARFSAVLQRISGYN